MNSKLFGAAAVALAGLVTASAAQAQTATRAWVSGHGTDTGSCGAPTAPCRSLQYAHDHIVASGGEIDVLDPAGYGTVTITKAISIINDGVGTAGVQSSAANGAAILINAGPGDAVILRGLDIEGTGASYGVQFTGGASVTLQDSTVKGFSFSGMQYEPTTSGYLFVSNSRFTNNASTGVNVRPVVASTGVTVQVNLEHIEAVNNPFGVFVDGRSAVQGNSINAVLANSDLANNATVGADATSDAGDTAPFLIVRNSTVTNSNTGAFAFGGATINVAHSTLTGNNNAFITGSGGVIGSYGDNNVDGNVSVGTTPSVAALQ